MQFSVSTIAALATVFSSVAQAAVVEGRAVAPVTGWDYQGCKTDAVKARALTGSFYFDDLMTVEKCSIACKNFTYMAVEFGHECFCGNTVNALTAAAPEAECSYKCEGKSAETCGAAPRINLYKKSITVASTSPVVPSYTPMGCYTDNTNNRALKGAVVFDSLMTTEMCGAICSGWSFFGTEYGRECFCGNSLTIGTFQVSPFECLKPCAGKSTENCGNSYRLSLYHYNA